MKTASRRSWRTAAIGTFALVALGAPNAGAAEEADAALAGLVPGEVMEDAELRQVHGRGISSSSSGSSLSALEGPLNVEAFIAALIERSLSQATAKVPEIPEIEIHVPDVPVPKTSVFKMTEISLDFGAQ